MGQSTAVPMPPVPDAPNQVSAMEVSSATSVPRSALQSTLGVASTAANLVLFPYVVAGRAAYQATSFAVTAPIKVTRHVAHSLSSSWQQSAQANEPIVDLFGEREASAAVSVVSTDDGDADQQHESQLVEGVLFANDVLSESSSVIASDSESVAAPVPQAPPGIVSQLVFLPIRLVSSGVSTAAALPASAISYGGRTLSGAMSSSQSLATSALVASSGLMVRTSRNVAHGITRGAFSTAHRVTGLVGTSVQSVSYVIPPSVADALWQGMARTGSMSTRVISYAIAVPAYRMAQALVPQINEYFTEQQCVDSTKDGVTLLVKTLGPQNAFYVLKYMYEAVNSEELYDGFLLCQDLLRESLDAENYKKAGASVSQATGIETLAPVVTEIYSMMPSLDELVDAAFLIGDLADEILGQPKSVDTTLDEVKDTGRFEYLSSEDDDDSDGDVASESGRSTVSVTDSESGLTQDTPVFASEAFSFAPPPEESVGGEETEGENVDDPLSELLDTGVSFFSSVFDSDEATALFNTFGDFLDVLVE